MGKGFSALLLLSALVLQLSACAPNDSAQVVFSGEGVIGGKTVTGKSPITKSIVALYDGVTGQLCTGSLLPNNIVLTAAHCIGPVPSSMFVIFDFKVSKESTMRQVERVVVSPLWSTRRNEKMDKGDIALVRFSGSLPSGYGAANLLPHSRFLATGTRTVVAGFGLSDVRVRSSAGTLRQTFLTIADVGFSATEVKVDQTKGTGVCHGDSGGPAYVTVAGHNFLWGVTSRGIEDESGNCDRYSAFTNILSYRAWISKVSAELSRGH